MGTIGDFDLRTLHSKYRLDTFIETGTGAGDSLDIARRHCFTRLFSIEIIHALYEQARARFSQSPECVLIHAASESGLRTVLSTLERSSRVLFWLDAHFPGADYGLAGYGDVSEKALRIPLERELTVIQKLRPHSRDVIIIDDLRIYEDGPYTNGNWPYRPQWGDDGIAFVENLFGFTHTLVRDYRAEGYLVLEPTSPQQDIHS